MSRYTPLLLTPLLLLGACGTYNGGVDSVYQPVVQRSDVLLDLQLAGDSLAAGESERLAGWLAAMGLRYGDRVAMDGEMAEGARAAIGAEAGRYGLMLASQAPVTPGQIAPGTVRVIVTRMTARVPNCPDFSRQYQPDFSASTTSNFGCATNSNLAAMVADPADLVRGATGSPTADPATGAKAINALRSAKPTGAGGGKLPETEKTTEGGK